MGREVGRPFDGQAQGPLRGIGDFGFAQLSPEEGRKGGKITELFSGLRRTRSR
jgi:hypothetical protein